MVGFDDYAREKTDAILHYVIKDMGIHRREKFLDDYASEILHIDKYQQNWENSKKNFRNANVPELKKIFSLLRNYDTGDLIQNGYDLDIDEDKFEEFDLKRLEYDLLTSLHFDLPNQPLLS